LSGRLQIFGAERLRKSPRKSMTISYFAEIKGLVGWECGSYLVFKVRDRDVVEN
jgi:hypothetical protein